MGRMEDTTHTKVPRVSIIIPSRNSESTIVDCLRSVSSQLHRPLEIIMVDSFSTDSTAEIARRMGATVLFHAGGRSTQKNWGAKFAKGEYLYFVDADFKLEPNVITACIEASDGVDGVVIRNQDIIRDSKVSRLIASRRKILSHDALNVAVRFVRKDVFVRLGGFDSGLYAGEDVDFHRRFLLHGFKMRYSQATEWHLGSPVGSKGLLIRNLYYSSNLLKLISKNPLLLLGRKNPLRVVAAWKKSDARGSDLLQVVLFGLISNVSVVVAALLRLPVRESREEMRPISKGLGKPIFTKADVISNYNREGTEYDNIRYGRTSGGKFFSEIELSNTLAMIIPGNVLHVGTATGRVSKYLASKGLNYVGVEISGVMARITKKNLNGTGDIVRCDAESLPFRNGVFDNVVSVRSFHFLPHPRKFLSQVFDALKLEGRVIVSFEKRIPGRHAFEKMQLVPTPLLRRNYYLNSEVFQLVEGAGLKPIFQGNVTRLPLLVYWRLSNDSILRRIHDKIPRWLGTVGVVVGNKSIPILTNETRNRRAES